MTKTYLTVASHWNVPGIRQYASPDRPAAERKAAELVDELIGQWADWVKNDDPKGRLVPPCVSAGGGDWEATLRALQLNRLISYTGGEGEANDALYEFNHQRCQGDPPLIGEGFTSELQEIIGDYVADDDADPDGIGFPMVWIEEVDAAEETAAPAAATNADLALVLDMAERFSNEGAIADGPDVEITEGPGGVTEIRPQRWDAAAIIRDMEGATVNEATAFIATDLTGPPLESIFQSLRDAGLSLSVDQPGQIELMAAVERLRAATALPSDVQPIGFALRNASGAISSLLHQVGQMKGMFGDEDGTIQAAVDAGEEAEIEIENALERLGLALGVGRGQPPITVAVSVSGGVLQWGGADREGVRLIVIDYDQDGVEEGRLVDMAEPTDTSEEWASVYEEGIEINAEAIARIVEKRDERALRELRFDNNQCVLCGQPVNDSAGGMGDGVCQRCLDEPIEGTDGAE